MRALTQKPIAVTPAKMGRRPLGIISTTVRLPKTVLEKIDALRGPGRRAEFIRQAVEEALESQKPKG